MKTWKKCAFIGILAIIVFAFIGCPPEKTVETGIKLEGVWQDPGVDQDKLNEIKAAFEKYYPDIRVIQIMESGAPGRTGKTIKLAKIYVNEWPENLTTSAQIRAELDPIYNNLISQAHDNGRHIYKRQFYS